MSDINGPTVWFTSKGQIVSKDYISPAMQAFAAEHGMSLVVMDGRFTVSQNILRDPREVAKEARERLQALLDEAQKRAQEGA